MDLYCAVAWVIATAAVLFWWHPRMAPEDERFLLWFAVTAPVTLPVAVALVMWWAWRRVRRD